MMRWAFLRRTAGGEWGGMENWMLKLARGLRRAGDACGVIAPRGSRWPDVCAREGFEFDAFAFGPEWAPVAAGRFAGLLRGLRPDVVLCAGFRDARRVRGVARRPAIGLKLPPSRALTDGFLDRWSFRHAVDRLLTDHRAARQLLLRHPWVSPGKILLAPNGVETDPGGPDPARRAAARAALGAPEPGTVAVVAAARFTADKRMMDAVTVFARAAAPVTALFLIGDGPQRGELEREALRLGLAGRVRFLGWRDDAAELLRGADIVLHPSLSEGMPNSVLEGMAAGAAVVATRAGGTSDIVTSGRDGFLFDDGDVEAMAAELRELVADPARRARVGAEAARRVAEAFSMETEVRRIRDGMAATVEARRLAGYADRRPEGGGWRRRSDAGFDPDAVEGAEGVSIRVFEAGRRRSPALKSFREAHRLELLGVHVVPHLAAGWRRTGSGPARPVLVTGAAAGAEPVLEWVRRHADLPEVLGALATAGGAWLGSLHALRIAPRNLAPENVLVRLGSSILPEFVLADLDRCRIATRWRAGAARRAFRRLYREFRPLLTRRQLLRFAVAYRRVRGIGRRSLRTLLRRLEDGPGTRHPARTSAARRGKRPAPH